MKRDLDLIRLVLLEAETGAPPEAMAQYPEDQVLYHIGLAIEAGLLEAQVRRDRQGDVRRAMIQRLTWAGHDFLDAARSDTVWNRAKEQIQKTGGAWTFEAVKALLGELIRQTLAGG